MWEKKDKVLFSFILLLAALFLSIVLSRQKIRNYIPNFLKFPNINQELSVPTSNPIIITLGFDDGTSSQFKIRRMLANRDMHAIFYVNTGLIGSPNYMTWKQLDQLYKDGNEIGSHAVNHPNLTKISLNNTQHEICDSRLL